MLMDKGGQDGVHRKATIQRFGELLYQILVYQEKDDTGISSTVLIRQVLRQKMMMMRTSLSHTSCNKSPQVLYYDDANSEGE